MYAVDVCVRERNEFSIFKFFAAENVKVAPLDDYIKNYSSLNSSALSR